MSRNLYAEITARIVAELERGAPPWVQEWSTRGVGGAMPVNAASGRAYSGSNVPMLWIFQQAGGYEAARWLTFKQALEAGGCVRRGERGAPLVYVSTIEREEDGEVRKIPFLKHFTVFNIAQCDGLPADLAPRPAPINPDARDALAESFVASTGVDLRHGEGRCYYSSRSDFVMMPDFSAFNGASGYYSNLFHELTHWTGAERRLNRHDKLARFGSQEYAAEELVAELGAAFLCAEFGFDGMRHSGYIENWIRLLKSDDRAFVRAASMASAACDYLRRLALAEPAALAA